MEKCEQIIIGWIRENCMKGKVDVELTASTPLLITNILDSLQFLSLVEFLSEQYNIEIDEDDLSPDNFESIAKIAELISTVYRPDLKLA